MVILSIASLTNNSSSGVNINIPKYVKILNEQCECGYLDCGQEDIERLKDFKNYFKLRNYKNFNIKQLPEPFNKPDIVVFQSLYIKAFPKIAKELKKLNIPYTIIPRCSMTKAAQNKKKWKKIIGNKLIFNKFIKNAKFIHFLTENEKNESTNMNFTDSVIIGNGTDMPNKSYKIKKRDIFKITYIGRIDLYHKGLDILIEAINLEKNFFIKNKIIFNIYGPDYEDSLNKIKAMIKTYNIENIVKLNGPVFGQKKEEILLDSDLFIQTSRLEGHPTGVIEAISYGIPVIITPGTNMIDDVKNNNLGFIANSDSESIAKTIIRAYKDKKNYQEISKNEIKFAKSNYDWKNIAKRIIIEYNKKL